MSATVKQVDIKAPPERVFSYVADLPRHGDWAAHNLQVSQTSSGPIGLGSTFESVGHQMGTHRDKLTITEYTPSSRLAFESTGDAGTVRHVFEVSPSGQGSRLAKSMEILKPSLVTRLMTPLIAMMGPNLLTKDVEKIKEQLESISA